MNYLIDFVKDATSEQIESYLTANSCVVVKIYSAFDNVYLVTASGEPQPDLIVESIINDEANPIQLLGEVQIDNPTLPTTIFSTEDQKDWWKNYVMDEIDFEAAQVELARRGQRSQIYLMDSGVNAAHPDFAEARIENLFAFNSDFTDTRGHGTALASVMVGKTCGLTDAKIKVVKIFDTNSETRQSDMLNALEAILQDFLLNAAAPSVLNCSWSIAKNSYIETKLQQLIDVGIYVVASAGNSGVPIDQVTPASMNTVLTIGSFNEDLTPSNFSNYTDPSVIGLNQSETNSGELDGWAPGEQIWVATVDGNFGYGAGTSIAAAIHSATLAYNLTYGTDIQGNLLINRQNQDIPFLLKNSLGRENLLNLSDPKYANSKNRVSTILSDYHPMVWGEPTLNIGVLVGRVWYIALFDPTKTKSAYLVDDTIEGISLNSNGELIIAPTQVDGGYKIQTTTLQVTDLNDQVTEMQLKMAIVDPNFDRQNLPEDDPLLDINLAEAECCVDVPCVPNGGNTACVYTVACYGGAMCAPTGTKGGTVTGCECN